MSLILDALNRSQRERASANEVPGIATRHPLEPMPRSDLWQKVLPWLGLVAALCVIAWLLLRGNFTAEKPEAEFMLPVAAVNSEAAVVTPVVSKVATTRPLVETPVAVKAPVEERKSAVEELYNIQVEEQTAAAKVENTPLPQRALESQRHDDTEQSIDIEDAISRAKLEVKNAELQRHPAPFLAELSQQIKDKIPTIYYTQHDYFGDHSQSTVTLNGETVRVGAGLVGGLKVKEILPDSVILNYSGTEFRLRALNSWINL